MVAEAVVQEALELAVLQDHLEMAALEAQALHPQ